MLRHYHSPARQTIWYNVYFIMDAMLNTKAAWVHFHSIMKMKTLRLSYKNTMCMLFLWECSRRIQGERELPPEWWPFQWWTIYKEVPSAHRNHFLAAGAACWSVYLPCCYYPLWTMEPSFFSLPMLTDSQRLSREPPGLQYQTRTAEASSPVHWATTGFSDSLVCRHLFLDCPTCIP